MPYEQVPSRVREKTPHPAAYFGALLAACGIGLMVFAVFRNQSGRWPRPEPVDSITAPTALAWLGLAGLYSSTDGGRTVRQYPLNGADGGYAAGAAVVVWQERLVWFAPRDHSLQVSTANEVRTTVDLSDATEGWYLDDLRSCAEGVLVNLDKLSGRQGVLAESSVLVLLPAGTAVPLDGVAEVRASADSASIMCLTADRQTFYVQDCAMPIDAGWQASFTVPRPVEFWDYHGATMTLVAVSAGQVEVRQQDKVSHWRLTPLGELEFLQLAPDGASLWISWSGKWPRPGWGRVTEYTLTGDRVGDQIQVTGDIVHRSLLPMTPEVRRLLKTLPSPEAGGET